MQDYIAKIKAMTARLDIDMLVTTVLEGEFGHDAEWIYTESIATTAARLQKSHPAIAELLFAADERWEELGEVKRYCKHCGNYFEDITKLIAGLCSICRPAGGVMVTDLEREVLRAYAGNDHVNDYGWQDPEAAAWVDVLSDDVEDCGINGKQFSGLMASLVNKGLMQTNGESCNLTQAGRQALKGILGNG